MYNFFSKMWAALCTFWNMIFNKNSVDAYQIGSSDVQAFFRNVLPDVTVTLADYEYTFTTLDDWKKILSCETRDNSPYTKNVRDCDDFADELKGDVAMNWNINGCLRASGLSESGTAHAFNVILYQDNDHVNYAIVEPQTGEIGCKFKINSIRG